MADVSQTPASVLASSSANTSRVVAGTTIVAGDVVYLDTATNEYLLADADAAASAGEVAIALCGADDGQPLIICRKDTGGINVGGTLVVGEIYVASVNAGKIAPASDLATGDFPVVLGPAQTASALIFNPTAGGAAKP